MTTKDDATREEKYDPNFNIFFDDEDDDDETQVNGIRLYPASDKPKYDPNFNVFFEDDDD